MRLKSYLSNISVKIIIKKVFMDKKELKYRTKKQRDEADDAFYNRLFIVLSIAIFLFFCYAMTSGIFKTLDAIRG